MPCPSAAARSELDAWRGEIRTVAVAAAGGIAAGAATVAAVNAVRARVERKKPTRVIRRGGKAERVVASRSFLDRRSRPRPLMATRGAESVGDGLVVDVGAALAVPAARRAGPDGVSGSATASTSASPRRRAPGPDPCLGASRQGRRPDRGDAGRAGLARGRSQGRRGCRRGAAAGRHRRGNRDRAGAGARAASGCGRSRRICTRRSSAPGRRSALDDDYTASTRRFGNDAAARAGDQAVPWLRGRRSIWPWEALLWAITEQLIEAERAHVIQRRIVAPLGRRLPAARPRAAPARRARARGDRGACPGRAGRARPVAEARAGDDQGRPRGRRGPDRPGASEPRPPPARDQRDRPLDRPGSRPEGPRRPRLAAGRRPRLRQAGPPPGRHGPPRHRRRGRGFLRPLPPLPRVRRPLTLPACEPSARHRRCATTRRGQAAGPTQAATRRTRSSGGPGVVPWP